MVQHSAASTAAGRSRPALPPAASSCAASTETGRAASRRPSGVGWKPQAPGAGEAAPALARWSSASASGLPQRGGDCWTGRREGRESARRCCSFGAAIAPAQPLRCAGPWRSRPAGCCPAGPHPRAPRPRAASCSGAAGPAGCSSAGWKRTAGPASRACGQTTAQPGSAAAPGHRQQGHRAAPCSACTIVPPTGGPVR